MGNVLKGDILVESELNLIAEIPHPINKQTLTAPSNLFVLCKMFPAPKTLHPFIAALSMYSAGSVGHEVPTRTVLVQAVVF